MNDTTLIILMFGPIVPITIIGFREFLKWWRLEIDQYYKWWRWIYFTESESGQQQHVAKGQNHNARWCVFQVDKKQSCRFRLHFWFSQLHTIGLITWDGREIYVEGRISRLTLASPLIAALWLAVIMGMAYLRSTVDPKLLPLLAISGGFTAGVCIMFGVMYLLLSALERVYFRRAYREIKAHLWQIEHD